MRRRTFLVFLGGAAVFGSRSARAQRQQRFRIGLLDTTGGDSAFSVPFLSKLEQLGYVQSRNLAVDHKVAQGNVALLKDFAEEFGQQQVDVIVTVGGPAGFAARNATKTIPIVLGAISDPVGTG